MKQLLIVLTIAFFFNTSSFGQTTITLKDAGKHIGDTVRICEKIMSSNSVMATEGKPTVLMLGNVGVDSLISIIIKAETRKRFDYKPEKDLLNRSVCITGKLELVDGRMMIVVNKQEDINIIK